MASSSSAAARRGRTQGPARGRAGQGGFAPAARTPVGRALSALRRGREAIVEIDGHLDHVLDWLEDPRKKRLDPDLPARLGVSARQAQEALARLGGPAGSELF